MITLKRVEEICSHFKEKKILIFGDIILDRYIFGGVSRISPEAPVPVVKVEKEESRSGGAGNVAANVAKLGAEGVLVGITGDDVFADELFNKLNCSHSIVRSGLNKTLVKTRVIVQRQQIVRIDREEEICITSEIEAAVLEKIQNTAVDGIIVSDYAKGSLTPAIMEGLKQKAAAEHIPIVVDPKPAHYHLYKDIDGITPNLKEAEGIINKSIKNDSDAVAAVKMIRSKFKTGFALITRGDRGITAGEKGKRTFHLPAFSHEVYDVTGAGDTVVSVLLLSLVSGANLKEAVGLANTAASIVVEKIGTSQVTVEEIHKRMKLVLHSR
ncbi:MAG TPA: PfkB family carbohydrate kinase [Candidatus Kapabacteria bacterium]|nr:PfkB family carbohydrate kinase [Candidatus Kapabacteria bacterium]